MIIQHIGHAEFMIETEGGIRVVTDPYGEGCGYVPKSIRADAVLVSHGHHDHNAVEMITGAQKVIDQAGIYTLNPGIHVTAIKGYHDNEKGTRRGETLLFLLEAEGLRIVHLGDLGCELNDEQTAALKNPDVLMIPVGGFYTIDGKTARKVADSLQAKVILPMHYKTKFNSDWPISGPEDFLEGFREEDIRRDTEALRITAGDLCCQPRTVIFKA